MSSCIYKNRLGKTGERFAVEHLTSSGYNVIRQNYRYDRAELDIICTTSGKKEIVFVEVKTRRSRKYGEPEESVTEAKMNQIRKAAQGFLVENEEYQLYDVRLDVITVMIAGGDVKINHIENAF